MNIIELTSRRRLIVPAIAGPPNLSRTREEIENAPTTPRTSCTAADVQEAVARLCDDLQREADREDAQPAWDTIVLGTEHIVVDVPRYASRSSVSYRRTEVTATVQAVTR